MRSRLKDKFPPEAVKTTAQCGVRKQLEEHISALEKEIDARAHKAPCHKCTKENGIERGDEAKKLILDKVAELKRLAKEEGDTPDHQLARALDKIEATKDENGATGGKMLGVLICKDELDNTVLIWAYSGTLNPESRGAGADEVRLERLLQAPLYQMDNESALKQTKEELDRRKKDTEAYDKDVKEIDGVLKAENTNLQKVFDAKRKDILEKEDAIRKKASEQQKREIDAAKEKYEKAAATRDAGFEAAKISYSQELEKASAEYQKVATASMERQRAGVEKAQSELKTAQEDARKNAEARKNDAAKKYEMETVQELKKRDTQLQKTKAELEQRMSERAGKFQNDEAKLKEALLKSREETALASKQDNSIEGATAGVWERPVGDALKSKSGDAEKLSTLAVGHEGTPHGVCSAPKMIQAAYGRGLKPVSMAEAWYGGGTNTHGELVASCNTCMKNIGFQLCWEKHAS